MKEQDQSKTRRNFLGTAAASAVVAGAFSLKAEAAEWTEGEKSNVQIVNEFCAAWSTRDMTKPLAFMSPDTVYRMTETTAPAKGHEGVTAQLKASVDASDRVEFKVMDTFAAGPIVINHRIDSFVSTTRPLIWEGVGVFFVQNGKIKEWSDYTIRVTR